MKYFHWLFLALFLVSGFAAAEETELLPAKHFVDQAKTQIKEIQVDDLAELQDSGAIVIDVREPDETRKGSIPGAEIVPRGMLEFRVARLTKDPDQPMVIYCRSGNRSALAALSLQDMGYRQVYSLDGGWKAWNAAQEQEAASPPDSDTR